MKKNSWLVLLASLLLCGCSTTITNLTPSTEKRQPNGLYPFEVALDVHQHSLRQETLQPYVLVGSQAYPMQRTPMLDNRWETLVPLPPDKEYVSYQFKINYEYNGIPNRHASSKLSRPYQLEILDK